MSDAIDCTGAWEFRLQPGAEPIDPAFVRSGYCHPAWGLIDVPAHGDASGPWDAGLVGDGPWLGLYRRELRAPPGGWSGWRLHLAGEGPAARVWWGGRDLGAIPWSGSAACPADGGCEVLVALAIAAHPRRRSPIRLVALRIGHPMAT